MGDMLDDNSYYASPSSSPPTPPSPLPVSVGPGNQKYVFSPSPSASPPFSSHTSTENLPLLNEKLAGRHAQVASAFSLDMPVPHVVESKSSCLQELLEWFIQRCCSCCSNSNSTSNTIKMQKSNSFPPSVSQLSRYSFPLTKPLTPFKS